MIKNQDIICFSFSDWQNEMVSNRHHILTRFAKNNRVFLFERPISLERYDRHRWRFLLRPIRKEGNLFLITPFCTSKPALNNKIYRSYLKKIYSRFKIKKPIFWFYNFEFAYLLDQFPHSLSCYHCTEDYSVSLNGKGKYVTNNQMRETEENLARRVDLIFAVSEHLRQKQLRFNPRAYLSANAVDFELYRKSQGPKREKFGQKPILGYAGNLSAKVNFKLIYSLATSLGCQVILAGPIVGVIGTNTYLTKLQQLPNVKFLGKLAVEDLPDLYREFDVCLMPYIQDDWFVKASQPLKLYEYLSSGKPIVSTKLACLKEMGQLVYEATNNHEFIDKVKVALREKNKDLSKRRINVAKRNIWDSRFRLINQKIAEAMRRKQ